MTAKKSALGDMYANIVRLLKVLEPLIICTAACEKVFSRVKLIVSEHRNRLKAETTNKPLMIALNRENGEDMNFDKVVELFLKRKKRQIIASFASLSACYTALIRLLYLIRTLEGWGPVNKSLVKV